jgi:DNA-binding NtrC family response regulator
MGLGGYTALRYNDGTDIAQNPLEPFQGMEGRLMGLVLVLDDELDACRLMQRVISGLGHEVHAFTDHHEALAWVQSFKPDLAVIDVKLREASGLCVLKSIQQMLVSTKVIMITGCPSEETFEEAMRMGVEDYLSKPLEIADLEEMVSRALVKSNTEC